MVNSYKIGFVGAGKVGKALGYYFTKKGLWVSGFYSKTLSSAMEGAESCSSAVFFKLKDLVESSDIVWITTNDGNIASVASEIAALPLAESERRRRTIIHTSGALDLKVLSVLESAGYVVATAHPLMAFGAVKDSVKRLSQCYFALEREVPAVNYILNATENHSFTIPSERKRMYHLASAFLSNYLVTIRYIAEKMFAKADGAIPPQAITTLIDSVLENMSKYSMPEALTGPIKRSDRETVMLHLESMEREMPQYVEVYKTLGRETMNMIENFELKDILE